MELGFWIIFGLLACFSIVLIFGAPYLPTHRRQIELSLDLLQLDKGEILYELGCGDGRLLLAAASRGYKAVGYEMNPVLFLICLFRARKYKNLITVKFGNFWNADLSEADGVYVFLLDRFMKRLDKKLTEELKPGVRLASYTFKIPGKNPHHIESGVFVYTY